MLRVVRLNKEEWAEISENAFSVAFNESRPKEQDRIDFAIVVETKELKPLGYATCREHDEATLYVQYGGTFHGARGTSLSYSAYLAGIDYCKTRYKRLVTKIENTNQVMLKFAMRAGFIIVGVNNYNGHTLLELMLEFNRDGI